MTTTAKPTTLAAKITALINANRPPYTGEWQGRPGTAWQTDSPKNIGQRVAVKVWADQPDTILAKVIKGDGRSPEFETIVAERAVTLEELAALIATYRHGAAA